MKRTQKPRKSIRGRKTKASKKETKKFFRGGMVK